MFCIGSCYGLVACLRTDISIIPDHIFYEKYRGPPLSIQIPEESLLSKTTNALPVDSFHRFVYGFSDPSPSSELWLKDDPANTGSDDWGGTFRDSPDLWIMNKMMTEKQTTRCWSTTKTVGSMHWFVTSLLLATRSILRWHLVQGDLQGQSLSFQMIFSSSGSQGRICHFILDMVQLKTFWTNPNVFSSKVNKKTPHAFEYKLQTPFSTILIVLISLTIISLVPIQSEAQPVLSRQQEKLLDNDIAFFLLDSFEYTLEVNGTQIFPNDTIKNSVVNEYTPSVYNISSIQYEILGHTINASDVQINVYPTKIDEVNTRVGFQIFANNAEVRGPSLNKSYDSLDIRSAYGIYNQATDKMTIHMPYSAAMQHLLQ